MGRCRFSKLRYAGSGEEAPLYTLGPPVYGTPVDEQELLHRIISRAHLNGWDSGKYILNGLERGLLFDPDEVVRRVFLDEEFARYFWKDSPHPEQHLLGMKIVENPLNYLAMYV